AGHSGRRRSPASVLDAHAIQTRRVTAGANQARKGVLMPLTVDIPERLDISWPHHHAIFHRRDFITHFLIPSVRALLKITLMHQ
ncbi:hypothetical protein, partial [Methylocella sp.]|uniref:hypothetical protein n=1 Tax=Methylocella sp. TaxID=1978226 RepID=UPI003C250148